MKVFENCWPVVLGGCAGPERSAFILTTSFPGPSTLGGCGGPDGLPATVNEYILYGLWHLYLAPGFLGVEFLLNWPLPPPCPLPLLNCLPPDGLLCLCFCGLPGEGVCPNKVCLLPELLHLLYPVVLLATATPCSSEGWAFTMVVWVSAFATGLLGRAFLKRLTKHLFEAED